MANAKSTKLYPVMMWLLLAVSALMTANCASPITPITDRPLRLSLAGQSNSGFIRPFLQARASVVGYSLVATIAPCWDDVPVVDNIDAGVCWKQLKATLTPDLDAFVWWQGEIEDNGTHYGDKLADLVRRVRAEAKNPNLLVAVMQLGPIASPDIPDGTMAEALRWVKQDAHAVYIETRDKEFKDDRTHMTDKGYADVADRIVQTIQARLR